MPRVKMPSGEIVDMPDELTPDQHAELSLHLSPSAQPAPEGNMTQALVRSLGLAARMPLQAAGSTVGMVGDALNSGINMAGEAIGHNPQLGSVSQPIQQGIDAITPVPQGDGEKIGDFAGTLLAGGLRGGVDPVARGITSAIKGAAPLYEAPTAASTISDTIRRAQDAGYSIPPNEARAGFPARALEAIGGKSTINGIGQQRNIAATDTLARAAAGLPKDAPLTHGVLSNAINDTYATGYKPITELGDIPAMPQYRQDLRKAMMDFQGESNSFPQAASHDVRKLLDSYDVGNFDAGEAVRHISHLRENAATHFKNGDAELGHAHKAVANALENNIENHLASKDADLLKQGIIEGRMRNGKLEATPQASELLSGFRNAREQLAKQYSVRDALIPGAGSVDALKIAAQLQGGAPLTGGLRTIGETAKVAPNALKYPTNAPSLFTGMEGGSLLSAALTGVAGGNPISGLLGSVPAARMAVRQGLMSGVGQRTLGRPTSPYGDPQNMMNAMPTAYNMANGLFGE